MKRIRLLLLFLFVATGTLPACAGDRELDHKPDDARTLHQSTEHFLDSLRKENRESVQLPMDHDERTNWSYFPGRRKGVSLADMNASEKRAFQSILKNGLSSKGYLKANGVIHLEEILGKLSGNPDYRDPEKYYATVFGSLEGKDPWGVRIEGHHLSLNYTSVGGNVVSVTPAFFGANPAVVPKGPYAGMEVLANEQHLARRLFVSLDNQQRDEALFRSSPPGDLLTRQKERVKLESFRGLPMHEMNETQKQLFLQMIKSYTGNFPAPHADRLFSNFRNGGEKNVYFAWAGEAEPGRPHYYRVRAPDILIEYANTRNGANHAHTVIRDAAGDFGRDKLADHLENSPHHQED